MFWRDKNQKLKSSLSSVHLETLSLEFSCSCHQINSKAINIQDLPALISHQSKTWPE